MNYIGVNWNRINLISGLIAIVVGLVSIAIIIVKLRFLVEIITCDAIFVLLISMPILTFGCGCILLANYLDNEYAAACQ